MGLHFKLAWRNILRNKRRTLIAGTAIGIGLATLIFTDGLMVGMNEHMVHSATASFLGEGQVHREGFRQTLAVEETVAELDRTVENLRDSDIVDRFTLRVMSFGMVTSPSTVEGVSIIGIDPDTEKYLSQMDDAMVAGAYFADDNQRDVVIGAKLAEILGVEVGDRLVITSSEAHTGELTQDLFRLSGIYRLNINEMDRAMVFIRLSKAQEMLGLPGQVHEIAIKFTDTKFGGDEGLPLWAQLSEGGNEAVGWTTVMSQLKAAMDMTDFSMLIVAVILFAVVSLGIINTLFMSLYERLFEFGVLRAVGTKPLSIARMVIGEAAALSVISIVLGIIIALVVVAIVARSGIDYRGIEYAGVTFRDKIYPVMRLVQFIKYPLWVFVLTTIVGLYPAVFAARITPARAMRKSF